MKNENAERSPGFKVACTWCGGLIRHNHVKDARGMCLECYARLLNEHFRPFRAGAALRQSER